MMIAIVKWSAFNTCLLDMMKEHIAICVKNELNTGNQVFGIVMIAVLIIIAVVQINEICESNTVITV